MFLFKFLLVFVGVCLVVFCVCVFLKFFGVCLVCFCCSSVFFCVLRFVLCGLRLVVWGWWFHVLSFLLFTELLLR